MYLYFSFKIFISILRLIRYWNYSPNDHQTSVKAKQMIGYDIHHKNSTICLRVHILNTLILINTIIPLWRISHFQEENSIRGGWMVCKFKCSILGPNQKEFRSKKNCGIFYVSKITWRSSVILVIPTYIHIIATCCWVSKLVSKTYDAEAPKFVWPKMLCPIYPNFSLWFWRFYVIIVLKLLMGMGWQE